MRIAALLVALAAAAPTYSTERNYLDCSTLRGEPNPMPKTDQLKTKKEIVKNLKASTARRR